MKIGLINISYKEIRNCNSIFKFFLLITFYLLLATCNAQTEFAPPTLTCVRNNGGQTELNWQLPSTPNPCFAGYEIYVANGNQNGPYVLNSTVANPLQTTLSIATTGAQPQFFYIINRGSCNNPTPLSIITSDTLDNRPSQPTIVLKKISIENGHAVLTWEPAPSPEVIAYLIFTDKDGFSSADTVFGRNNITYTDLVNDPSKPIIYKLRAFEICENGVGKNGDITPNTIESRAMLLNNQAPVDKCQQAIQLSWSAYKFGNINPLSYEIQTNTENAGFITKGNTNSATVNFALKDIPFRQKYCIRIKAILPGNDSSFSNEFCFDSIDVVQKPKNDYIRNISVENGNVVIEYIKDTLATPERRNILYRSSDNVIYVGQVNIPTEPNFYTFLYTDANSETQKQNYYYYINLIDSCSNEHASDTAVSILISIRVKNNNKAEINWTGFSVDNINFIRYRLEKIEGPDTTLIGYYTSNQNNYLEDELFDYTKDSINEVCYRITAEFQNLNEKAPQQVLESHSNIICVQPEPLLLVPQAFAPNGYNQTFKPFLLYAKTEGYSFQIYDRWGQLLFSTTDINDRWDGTFKGAPAPLDGYVFLIKYTGKNNQNYAESGTIMLMR